MRATVWNDAFQMLIVLTGFSLLLGLGADSVGGLDKALDIADKGGRITFGIDECVVPCDCCSLTNYAALTWFL